VRRIEAVTGIGALEHYQQQAQTLRQLASQLNVGEDAVLAQVEKLSQTAKQLEKQWNDLKRQSAMDVIRDIRALISDLDDRSMRESREKLSQLSQVKGNSRVVLVSDFKVVLSEVQDIDRKQLREFVDILKQDVRRGVVVIASVENGDISLIAGVTKDLTAKVHAGKLIGALAEKLGGKGGGRPDLAEAGGKDTAGLKTALQTVPSYVEGLL
jgi:alanyl-tRNA synthetase